MGERERYFAVNVTLTAPTETNNDGTVVKPVNSVISISGGSYENNPTSITFKDDDDNYVSEVSTTIYIKHDEKITLSNIPYGVTYTVTETDYSDDGYTTSYAQDDTHSYINEDEETITTEGTINLSDTAKETVTITNNKGMDVDTGIFVDNLPYIIILAGVAVGMGVFFMKKRTANNN